MLERLAQVQRLRQRPARLGQEAARELGPLELGDVLDHDDRDAHRAAGAVDGARLHPCPAVAAVRVAVADGQRLRALADQRPPPGQRLDRDGRPELVARPEAPAQLLGLRQQHGRGVGEAEQPHRGVVGVDQAPARLLHHDRVGDALEDRRQLVARLAQLGEQARVVDREREAVGQLLRHREVPLAVAAAGDRGRQRDVPDHLVAHPQWHDQRGHDADLPQQAQLLGILRDLLPEALRGLRHQQRLAAADDLRRADRGVGVERVATVVLLDELPLGRVRVLHHRPRDAAVRLQQLDEAPVGVSGDGQPRDGGERLLEVERAREERARL